VQENAECTSKICTKCDTNKPISEYGLDSRMRCGHKAMCKSCVAKWAREHRKRNPDIRKKQVEYAKQWRANNPERHAFNHKTSGLKKYGLTVESYQQLLDSQSGLCAICESVPVNPHVDHDHDTGKVRGILCGTCNSGIGYLKDNSSIVEKAALYLKNHGR
jgi:hypothetical protein